MLRRISFPARFCLVNLGLLPILLPRFMPAKGTMCVQIGGHWVFYSTSVFTTRFVPQFVHRTETFDFRARIELTLSSDHSKETRKVR